MISLEWEDFPPTRFHFVLANRAQMVYNVICKQCCVYEYD